MISIMDKHTEMSMEMRTCLAMRVMSSTARTQTIREPMMPERITEIKEEAGTLGART